MTFVGSKTRKMANHDFVLHGDLSIIGVAQPMKIILEFGGIGQVPWGNTRECFNVNGIIHRSYWILSWKVPFEHGEVLLSDEIRVNADIQMSKFFIFDESLNELLR